MGEEDARACYRELPSGTGGALRRGGAPSSAFRRFPPRQHEFLLRRPSFSLLSFFFRLYLFLRREPRSRGLGRFDTVTMTTLSRSAGSRNYRSTRKRRKKLRWRKGTLPLARLPACLPSFLPACVPILEFRGGRLPCQRAGWPGGRSVQVMGEGAAKRREKARSLSLVVVGLCPSPGGILQRKNLPLDF